MYPYCNEFKLLNSSIDEEYFSAIAQAYSKLSNLNLLSVTCFMHVLWICLSNLNDMKKNKIMLIDGFTAIYDSPMDILAIGGMDWTSYVRPDHVIMPCFLLYLNIICTYLIAEVVHFAWHVIQIMDQMYCLPFLLFAIILCSSSCTRILEVTITSSWNIKWLLFDKLLYPLES